MNEVRELGQELIEQGEVSHTHEVLPAICSRRSIRQFTDAPLSGEDVQILLEAGLRAPSSRGAHTTQFILVESRETLTELSYMRPDGADFLRQVPLGIVILGSPMECERWIADASLAAGYIQLQVRNVLGIPYQLEVLCIIAVGHKASSLAPHAVEELRWEQIHIGCYPPLEKEASQS